MIGFVELTAVTGPTAGTTSLARLHRLQRLAAELGGTMTPDDVARAALASALEVDGVVRAGLAIVRGAGRQLEFVASDDDSLGAAHVRWCHIDALDDVPLTRAVMTGNPVFLPDLDALGARFPQLLDRQRSLGTRSLAALPLVTGSRPIGGLLLAFGSAHAFDLDARAFLEAIAAQVAQAVRRALAYQAEQTNSERLQRSLLPQSLPELDGLAFGAYYRAGGAGADVGGDWYDVLALPDGRVAVAVGDVMGKGVSAAIVMSEIRAAVRAYALLDPRPDIVLQRLDGFVASLARPEQLATLAYGVLDSAGHVDVALAGHPAPLVVPRQGPAHAARVPAGPPLGIGDGPWPVGSVELPHDGVLLLFSDGLVESRALDLDAGLQRLADQVGELTARRRNPRELCAVLGERLGTDTMDDDVTMLAVGPARHLRTATASLPADPSATPQARRFLGRTLSAWGLDEDLVATAQLCVSELVTNAVMHAGTSTRVTARLDAERLLVLVQDRGRHGSARRLVDADLLDASGRGLALVEALATAWSAERSADGTTVWFELEAGVG